MIDTCQANTMYSRIYSPNIIALGSSELAQSSYSHHSDSDVGVAVIDRYTYYILEFLEGHVNEPSSKKTLGDLIDSYDESKIHSTPGLRYDLFPGGEKAVRERLLMDFFGNAQNVEIEPSHDSNVSSWLNDMQQLAEMATKARNGTIKNKKVLTSVDKAFSKQSSGLIKKLDCKEPSRVEGQQIWNDKNIGISVLAGSLGVWALSVWLDGRG